VNRDLDPIRRPGEFVLAVAGEDVAADRADEAIELLRGVRW
jgi:hypothetical protein